MEAKRVRVTGKLGRYISILLMVFLVIEELFKGIDLITGKPSLVAIFYECGFSTEGIMVLGIVTVLNTVIILFPAAFVWGCFLMASRFVVISGFYLLEDHVKAAVAEGILLLLVLLLLRLGHPFSLYYRNKKNLR